MATLHYDGERMVPEAVDDQTFWEHVYRYRFASGFACGKRVLDIACGEGYGTAALQRAGAASVIGVDISALACEHGREKYGIRTIAGDARKIPLKDHSVDLVVSFETIEHVEDPENCLDEFARVLGEGGTLIVSSPNRSVYGVNQPKNPFHHHEMDEHEFRSLVSSRFRRARFFAQYPQSVSRWNPRSLALKESPWVGVGGYYRLRKWLCPHLYTDPGMRHRRSVVDWIGGRDRWGAILMNPYEIRGFSGRGGERPRYFVAVARN